MAPNGGGEPSGELKAAIEAAFGSTQAFREQFAAKGVGHFASGWAWLVLKDGKLAVTSYHDADTPLVHGVTPLLTADVWEHAYYLDFQNARAAFIEAFLGHLANWDEADRRLQAALA